VIHATHNIVAIASPPGRGAIGIVRVSGSDLSRILTGVLGKAPSPRHATLTPFLDEAGSVIDEGIAIHFPSPESYTGEDVLELQAHGGPAVLARLVRACIAFGARTANPGEFTYRAYLNEKMDLVQAEGAADLIASDTEQAARCAVRSLRGEFSRAIDDLCSEMIELRSNVEATLDFPDEEVELLRSSDALGRLGHLLSLIADTVRASRRGSILREGIQVVLAGRPNVGKSSLMNCLAGEDIAIVTDVPGTTRDAIRQILQVQGVPVHVVDTAGLREAQDPVERMGIERTWSAIEHADVVLLVREVGDAEERAEELRARFPNSLPLIEVMNKIDLIDKAPSIEHEGRIVKVWLSARTGAGLSMLGDVLLDAVGWDRGREGIFMARERHLEALGMAEAHVTEAVREVGRLELLAEQLRLAHEALASIVGVHTPDELLGEIFSKFCVGK
jgi:tRNA modification GTPase